MGRFPWPDTHSVDEPRSRPGAAPPCPTIGQTHGTRPDRGCPPALQEDRSCGSRWTASGIEFEVTGDGRPGGAAPRLSGLGSAVAPPGSRAGRRGVPRRSFPTCGATAHPTSPPRSTPTPSRSLPATCSACSTTSASNGRTSSATTGVPRSPGRSPRSSPIASTTSSPCPSAIRRRSRPPASSRTGEVVVHAPLPVRGRRRAVAVQRRLGQLARLGRASRRERGRSPSSREERVAHPGAQRGTAPTSHPRPWSAPAIELPPVQAPTMGIWSSGDMALLEHADDGLVRTRRRSWRYERHRGPGPLDAARAARRGQRPAARLPARMTVAAVDAGGEEP